MVDIGINVYLSTADQITLALFGFGSALAGALPNATAAAGTVTFNNSGGSGTNPVIPLQNAVDNGQAIALFNCVTGYNRIAARFLVTLAGTNPNLNYPSVFMPVVGANGSTTAIGFNSSSATAGTALYGGGIFQSYMIVQEILFP